MQLTFWNFGSHFANWECPNCETRWHMLSISYEGDRSVHLVDADWVPNNWRNCFLLRFCDIYQMKPNVVSELFKISFILTRKTPSYNMWRTWYNCQFPCFRTSFGWLWWQNYTVTAPPSPTWLWLQKHCHAQACECWPIRAGGRP